MGIIPDAIAMAAFTQHSRAVSDVDPVIVEAIQGKRGLDWKPTQRLCPYILRNSKNCPNIARKDTIYCSRHSK